MLYLFKNSQVKNLYSLSELSEQCVWLLKPFGMPDVHPVCLSNLNRSGDHRATPAVHSGSKWKAVTLAKSAILCGRFLSRRWSRRRLRRTSQFNYDRSSAAAKAGSRPEDRPTLKETRHPAWTHPTSTKHRENLHPERSQTDTLSRG